MFNFNYFPEIEINYLQPVICMCSFVIVEILKNDIIGNKLQTVDHASLKFS